MYNGGISNFWPLSYIKSRMSVAQISQGLSYKICSTTSPKLFPFGSFVLVFEISAIIHQQLVAMLREHVRFVYILIPQYPNDGYAIYGKNRTIGKLEK